MQAGSPLKISGLITMTSTINISVMPDFWYCHFVSNIELAHCNDDNFLYLFPIFSPGRPNCIEYLFPTWKEGFHLDKSSQPLWDFFLDRDINELLY